MLHFQHLISDTYLRTLLYLKIEDVASTDKEQLERQEMRNFLIYISPKPASMYIVCSDSIHNICTMTRFEVNRRAVAGIISHD
jgi:hypothetical protein